MKKFFKDVLNKVIGNYWKPMRTIWPHPSGYCCWNDYRKTMIDNFPPTREGRERCFENCNKINLEEDLPLVKKGYDAEGKIKYDV